MADVSVGGCRALIGQQRSADRGDPHVQPVAGGVEGLAEQAVELRARPGRQPIQARPQVGQAGQRRLGRRGDNGVEVAGPGERRARGHRSLDDVVRGDGRRRGRDMDQLDLTQRARGKYPGSDLGLAGLGDVLAQHRLP